MYGVNSFSSAKDFLNGRSRRKIMNNTYIEEHRDNIAVHYYYTDIVTYYNDGKVGIDSGGYIESHCITERIREFLPIRFSLINMNRYYDCYIIEDTKKSTCWYYQDGMIINPDGTTNTGHPLKYMVEKIIGKKPTERRVKKYLSSIDTKTFLHLQEECPKDFEQLVNWCPNSIKYISKDTKTYLYLLMKYPGYCSNLIKICPNSKEHINKMSNKLFIAFIKKVQQYIFKAWDYLDIKMLDLSDKQFIAIFPVGTNPAAFKTNITRLSNDDFVELILRTRNFRAEGFEEKISTLTPEQIMRLFKGIRYWESDIMMTLCSSCNPKYLPLIINEECLDSDQKEIIERRLCQGE